MPITVFVHKDTTMYPDTEMLFEKIAHKIERGGINAWFDLEISELLGDEASNYRKVPTFGHGLIRGRRIVVLVSRDGLHFPADYISRARPASWLVPNAFDSTAIR